MTLLYGKDYFPESSTLVRRDPRLGLRIIVYLLRRSFSKNLDITDTRLIGLYDAISVGFLSPFW